MRKRKLNDALIFLREFINLLTVKFIYSLDSMWCGSLRAISRKCFVTIRVSGKVMFLSCLLRVCLSVCPYIYPFIRLFRHNVSAPCHRNFIFGTWYILTISRSSWSINAIRSWSRSLRQNYLFRLLDIRFASYGLTMVLIWSSRQFKVFGFLWQADGGPSIERRSRSALKLWSLINMIVIKSPM